MPLHSTISHLVTQRRGLIWLGVAVLAALSLFVLATRMKLDTEVLNLLPRGFESVEGLKIYNRDFAQVRELTFALVSTTGGRRPAGGIRAAVSPKASAPNPGARASSAARRSRLRKACAICKRSPSRSC